MPKNVNPLAVMVRKLETHTPLGHDDRAALLALPHTLRTYENQTYLVRRGGDRSECVVLLAGFAFRWKQAAEGLRQIVSVYVPGDLINLDRLFLNIVEEHIEALTITDVAMIPREAMLELARSHPAAGYALITSSMIEGLISREWMLNIGRRDARTRVAHLLCEFSVRLSSGPAVEHGYDLPMTQEQLGDILGLTTVHVNRMVKSLEAEGLLIRKGRYITFPDWNTLCRLADFSPRYLHPNDGT